MTLPSPSLHLALCRIHLTWRWSMLFKRENLKEEQRTRNFFILVGTIILQELQVLSLFFRFSSHDKVAGFFHRSIFSVAIVVMGLWGVTQEAPSFSLKVRTILLPIPRPLNVSAFVVGLHLDTGNFPSPSYGRRWDHPVRVPHCSFFLPPVLVSVVSEAFSRRLSLWSSFRLEFRPFFAVMSFVNNKNILLFSIIDSYFRYLIMTSCDSFSLCRTEI